MHYVPHSRPIQHAQHTANSPYTLQPAQQLQRMLTVEYSPYYCDYPWLALLILFAANNSCLLLLVLVVLVVLVVLLP